MSLSDIDFFSLKSPGNTALLDCVKDGIIIVDFSCNIVAANLAFATLIGKDKSELILKNISDVMGAIIPEEEKGKFSLLLTAIKEKKDNFDVDLTIRGDSDNKILLKIENSLLRDEESPVYAVAVFKKIYGRSVSDNNIRERNIKLDEKCIELKKQIANNKKKLLESTEALKNEITEREYTEKELQGNRLFLEKILETNPNIIYIYDFNQKCNIFSNRNIPDILGYKNEDIPDNETDFYNSIIHPEDIENYLSHRAKLRNSLDGFMLDIEYRLKDKRGEWRWFHSRDTVFQKSSNGEPVQILGSISDIGNRKENEKIIRKEKEKAQLFLEMAGTIILTIEKDQTVSLINRKGCEVLGYNADEIIGKNWYDNFIPVRSREERKEVFEQLMQGITPQNVSFEINILTRNGEERTTTWHNDLIRNEINEITGILASGQDITEHILAEHEIADYARKLEVSNKELEAFSYSVSHDLRAPLRAIDGFSKMVLEDFSDKLDSEGIRQLNVIRYEAQKMGELIDDILAFSRMGRQQMRKTEIDMDKLAKEVYINLMRGYPGRKINFNTGLLPPAYGDRSLISEVFLNLIGNSIKFTKNKPDASITIKTESKDGETIYSVCDNGVGFDMRYYDKLFGVFQRLHSANEFDGTGVGLALAQRIIHRHDGKIWAESEVDKGASFYFTLPWKE